MFYMDYRSKECINVDKIALIRCYCDIWMNKEIRIKNLFSD